MKVIRLLPALFVACASLTGNVSMAAEHQAILKPEKAIEVSAKPQRFDLMAVDNQRRRLIVAHSEAGTLTVVNLSDSTLDKEIPVGVSAGVAVDSKDEKYFVGTEKGVAVVDRKTLRKTGFINTPGPVDAIAFDARNNRLYAGHDDAKELWVVDTSVNKIADTIRIPGAPELMTMDQASHRLYLNIKPKDEVVTINTQTNKIVNHWSSLPTRSPHGIALDLQDKTLFVAGHAPVVSEYVLATGKPIKQINIGSDHVDQIAYDATLQRLYCPSQGKLFVLAPGSASDVVKGSVKIPAGTHSIAVDPMTHKVWIAYTDNGHSYVRAYVPKGR